jgi:predicted RNA-binding Zn-ribbon protein involved in translation (DUF1610 family)
MISDITTTLNVLRQEAAAIGITEEAAKKYGNIRHKRTWSLAIEHHLSMQAAADRIEPPSTPQHPNSSPPNHSQISGKIGESRKPEVELTANLCESVLKIDRQTASPSEMLTSRQQQVKQPVRSDSKSAQRIDRYRGFQQVVQNHIKALKNASATRTNSTNSQLSNWVCPECGHEGEISCHLCSGEGHVSDIAAIGWTLAYMEMLGCSAKEIEPLRKLSPSSNILEMDLEICLAIKQSTEVLARTEKWVMGNW